MPESFWPFGREREPLDAAGDTAVLPATSDPAEAPEAETAERSEPDAASPAGTPRSRRERFRDWRRSRPFWGGVLMLVGGAEIAVIPLAAWRLILVAPSVVVAAGVGVVVFILGVVTLMTPSQNKLYGLLAVLMGVVSFVTSNLGGFLVGAVLSIVGGALAFAWVVLTPDEQDPEP